MAKPDEISGKQRAAILLMSLGEADAASLLKQLDAGDVQKLGLAMADLKEVSRDQMSAVLDKFIGVVDAKAGVATASKDYVRRVLTQAVGKQKADSLLDRVQAAAILPLLPEAMRTDVLLRIASLNEVPQSAINELDQLVEKQASAAPVTVLRRVGGTKAVADILKSMEGDESGAELGKIEAADVEMHRQIKDLLFVFDDLMNVDDRGIQALLREVGSDSLAVALRGAEPDVQDKILRNMSKRAAEILKDDMEARGPVKLADVEAAQKEIVVIAARLAEEGTITLGGKGGGEFV